MSEQAPKYSEATLLKTAKDLVEKKTKDSVVLDRKAEKQIPTFSSNELAIGRVLGRGGFCVVSEVTKITLQEHTPGKNGTNGIKSEDEHYIHNVVQDRGFMSGHCIRQGKDCRYAIKRMQEASKKDPQLFVNSIVDLAIEARFLSVVRHPHIIKMRAMEEGHPFHTGFFVVLDRLYDIMPVRLMKWKKRRVAGLKKLFDFKGKKAEAFWIERLAVAYDIACALNYLHGMSIIYRDLKPDNVGFDVRGDVKIFDFGLARELHPDKALPDGTYKLTADTGSLRYMAPEVALGKTYNETADTFSFSIMCWQIFAIATPYEGFTMKMFTKTVLEGGARPKIDEKWGTQICSFLKSCFVNNPKRPTMSDACEILREELSKLGDDDDLMEEFDNSRKSMLSAD